MTEHLELSRNALRRAIVETLQSRPHQSCKKIDLPNEVCRQSNINLKGNIRKALKGIIRREVGSLTRAKIIQEYTAKNVRVRLTSNYIKKYEKLLKMQKGNDTIFDSHRDFWSGDHRTSDDMNSEEQHLPLSNLTHSALKPLPELSGDGDFSSFDTDTSDIDSDWDDETEIDKADERLLNVFTESGIEEKHIPNDTNKQEITPEFDFASLRSSVEAYTIEYDSLQIKVTINRIQVIAEIQDITATINISLNRHTHSIDFLTRFSGLDISPEKLLTLSATDQFSSIPGLIYEGSGPSIQLRRNLASPGDIASSLPAVLDEVLADAILVVDNSNL
jgi:hypothetical protein